MGRLEATGADVIAALFSKPESQCVYFITQENITHTKILDYVTHNISTSTLERGRQPLYNPHSPDDMNEQVYHDKDPLALYTTNINARTLAGLIDPLIDREDEIQRTMQVLCRRSKNNPLLVGEPGVGKTAIAEGLARLIIDNKVPNVLKDSVIYSLDLGLLLAGTKYRGDLEQRLKDVLSALSEKKGAILFIDEIHAIIGAGSTTGSSVDISNLIKPALASDKLTCIGSTTYDEYRRIFEKDHALNRRFQRSRLKNQP